MNSYSFTHPDIQNQIVSFLFMRDKIIFKHLTKENLKYFKEKIKIRKLQKIAEYIMNPSESRLFYNLTLLKDINKMIYLENNKSGETWFYASSILNIIEEIKFVNFCPNDELFKLEKFTKLKRIIFETDDISNKFISDYYPKTLKEIVFISPCTHNIPVDVIKPILNRNIKIGIKLPKQTRDLNKKSKNILYIGNSLF